MLLRMVVSSNKGSGRIADSLGAATQRHYLDALGMLKKIDIGLPETAQPIVPTRWKRAETITISYGYGLSVTPLHLVSAMATTVGTGWRVTPSLIKGGDRGVLVEVFDEYGSHDQANHAQCRYPPARHRQESQCLWLCCRWGDRNIEKNKVGGYDRKVNITSFAGISRP